MYKHAGLVLSRGEFCHQALCRFTFAVDKICELVEMSLEWIHSSLRQTMDEMLCHWMYKGTQELLRVFKSTRHPTEVTGYF